CTREWCAIAASSAFGPFENKKRIVIQFLIAHVVVVIAYLPWLPVFLFQGKHAGHPPVPINGASDLLLFIMVVGVRVLLQATLLPYPVGTEGTASVTLQQWM